MAGPRRRQDRPAGCLPKHADPVPDQGFAGRMVDWAKRTLRIVIDIVRKPAAQRGFEVHPERWVVERTLAWPTAHRRLARDYERDPEVSEEMVRWAAISQMLRRITRG